MPAAQPAQGQRPPRRAAVEQQRQAFAGAAAALEAALENVIASGRVLASAHRGRVLDPGEVLRLLQLPAVVHAALPCAQVPARL